MEKATRHSTGFQNPAFERIEELVTKTHVDTQTPTGWIRTERKTGKREIFEIGRDGYARIIRKLPPMKPTMKPTMKPRLSR